MSAHDEKIMADAIEDFAKAWTALSRGDYSPQQIEAWLNSSGMKRSVRQLLKLSGRVQRGDTWEKP